MQREAHLEANMLKIPHARTIFLDIKASLVVRFAKMILRDRCSTSYDLASLLRGRRRTLDRWNGKIAKQIGARTSALH